MVVLVCEYSTSNWHDIFNEPTIADATLDRFLHRTHFINLQGTPMKNTLTE